VHVKVPLMAGDQLVTLYCETGGFNLDYFRLS
jgi:glucosylceramidase